MTSVPHDTPQRSPRDNAAADAQPTSQPGSAPPGRAPGDPARADDRPQSDVAGHADAGTSTPASSADPGPREGSRPGRVAPGAPIVGSAHSAESWVGRTVHGRDGSRLGTLSHVYPPDAATGPTAWGLVKGRFGGRKLVPLDAAAERGAQGVTVPVDRAAFRTARAVGSGSPDARTRTDLDRHYTGRGALAVARERQHDRFGGVKIGAAFFGWIVAVGLTVILGAVAAGIAALTGFSFDLSGSPAVPAPETVGLVGAITVVVVLGLAYLGGGYVAGRLARFDGARNGVATWFIGLVVAVAVAIAGTVAGARFDVMNRVQIPSIALPTGALTIGGIVLVVVIAIVCLLTATLGGRAGERYHRRVDRAATVVE